MEKHSSKKHKYTSKLSQFGKNKKEDSRQVIAKSKSALKHKQQMIMKQKQECQPGINQGDWTIAQNLRYMKFLCKYKEDIENDQVRRRKKIFTLITANQCRSHHQKYCQKFHCVDLIIEFINLMARTVKLQKAIQNKQTNEISKSEQKKDLGHEVTIQNGKIRIQISIQNISSWKKEMQNYIQ